MKISPISVYSAQNANPNFKGLWGKSETTSRTSSWPAFEDTITLKYHPFADETDEQITAVRKDNESFIHEPRKYPAYDLVTTTCVEIQPRLSFTSDQYLAYRTHGVLGKVAKEISDKGIDG